EGQDENLRRLPNNGRRANLRPHPLRHIHRAKAGLEHPPNPHRKPSRPHPRPRRLTDGLGVTVHRQTLPNLLLFKLIFLQKAVLRPPILPVFRLLSGSIREEPGRDAPLDDPAEFASPQARMEPRRLEMCECRRPQGERGNGALSYLESIARKSVSIQSGAI